MEKLGIRINAFLTTMGDVWGMAAQGIAENRHVSTFRRDPPPALVLAFIGLFGAIILLLLAIALFGRARDGEPVVRLDIRPPAPHHLAAAKTAVPAPKRPAAATNLIGASPAPPALPARQPPVAAAAPATSARPQLPPAQLPPAIVPGKIDRPVYAGQALVADPALIEVTPQGPLPRIADDGRTPMTAYAPPVAPGARLRIALVMSGLGISARQTSAALEKLPPQVTLAFAPYSNDVQRWVSEARRLGHEVLLEVPMEPYDFPDSDPGPHTLRSAVSEESNTERLTWSLTRFTGYAGITNLLGERFLSDSDALAPVMTYLARRGLLFFDNGLESRSVAPDIARQTSAPFVQSQIGIDTIQTAMEIDSRLSQLEAHARSQGSAAGTGFIYPITMERVAIWANGLAGRGFVLAPASAIVAHSK